MKRNYLWDDLQQGNLDERYDINTKMPQTQNEIATQKKEFNFLVRLNCCLILVS